MQETILSLMGEYGNLAVFLLILVENLFPPIPSEVILTFGGVMTTCTKMTAAGVIAAATLGSVAGAVLLYFAGYLIPDDKMKGILEGRVGRLLHFEPEDVDLARTWFLKKGKAAVFLCRCVPIVRSLISVPAGVAKMPMTPFLLLTTAGSLVWNTVLVFAGKAAGDSWERVSRSMGTYSNVFLMVFGTGLFLFAMIHWSGRETGDKEEK